MIKVLQFIMLDIIRRKIIFAYTAFLFLITAGMYYFNSEEQKVVLSLMNILFLVVPLMCIVFGTIYFYNAREFVVLLLAQPVSRGVIFMGQLLGLSASLCLALLAGVGLPVLLFGGTGPGMLLVGSCLLLTLSFTAMSIMIALRNDDKARGTGYSLLTWFYFTFLFDGLILLFILYFSDYPVERTVIAVSMLNPIDIARILVMMNLDVSAMMGYTGALFTSLFNQAAGQALLAVFLMVWCMVPAWLASRRFLRKDF